MRTFSGLLALFLSFWAVAAHEVAIVRTNTHVPAVRGACFDWLTFGSCICRTNRQKIARLVLVSIPPIPNNTNLVCSDSFPGMYSRTTWGGPIDPFILIKFFGDTPEGSDPTVSLILFQWADKDLVGVPQENVPGPVSYASAGVEQMERRT